MKNAGFTKRIMGLLCIVPDAYYAAIKELKLNPIGEPDIEVGYVIKGEPVVVKAIVPLRPEVVLGSMEGLEISVPSADPVGEKDSRRALETTRQAVLAAALDRCDFSVPESLVMERARFMLEQFSQQLISQGGSIELYLQMMNSNVDTLKMQIWKDAKQALRSEFLLDKSIAEKGFELSEEETIKELKPSQLKSEWIPGMPKKTSGLCSPILSMKLKPKKRFNICWTMWSLKKRLIRSNPL